MIHGFHKDSNLGILSRKIASIFAWIIACVTLCMQRELFFHAFAMVCLAAVDTKSKSLNWQRVKICGLLFSSATVRSGGKVTWNIIEMSWL